MTNDQKIIRHKIGILGFLRISPNIGADGAHIYFLSS